MDAARHTVSPKVHELGLVEVNAKAGAGRDPQGKLTVVERLGQDFFR
jgi:hypothetical protein